jgi:two-component system, response regulator PdtaR
MSDDSRPSRPRILVVEDEAIVACELRARLESFGYDVIGVADCAHQAYEISVATPPDLVLMDVQIRGEADGILVAERLRNTNLAAVIFLTAHSNSETVQRAKATEPFAYLLKPYDETELRIAIEVALFKRRAELERQELTRQLQQALRELKTLRGLIPICAWCRKLRSDNGFWLSVEAYLGANTEAACTHSICPECYQKQLAGSAPQLDLTEASAETPYSTTEPPVSRTPSPLP